MGRQYDIVFPGNARQELDGGKNSKFARSIIADNESPDVKNVIFTNGACETRLGSTKLNTSAIGSFTIDGLYTRHDYTGASTMVAFAGGSMWQLNSTTFSTIGSAQSVFTAGVRVGTAEFENHMFIGNGYVTPYKYNGVAFTRHGVPAATGAVSVASATTSTGVLTGDYRYKVTYINSASVEGDVGTSTVTITATNAKLILTGIPTAPQSHGVGSRYIYRTAAGGSTFKRIATIADNTTTSYVDNTSDASLGATAPTDNGEPPKYSFCLYHQGRLFCNDTSNPNYIWYSNSLEPYTFASTNFQPIGDASFDLVRGASVYSNGILVQCENSLFYWDMPSTDPTAWRVIKIRSQYGSKSPFGTFLFDNKIMVPAMQNSKFSGFAAIAGTALDPEVTYLDSTTVGGDLHSDRIETDAFLIQEAYAGQISAFVFKNKAYISVPYDSGATTNNRVYLFDFSISNLGKKQKYSWVPLTGINATQFTEYGGNLYYGSSTATGFVYKLEPASTFSDDGSAIDSYIWTKEFSGLPGHENLEKDFRKLKILVEKTGNYYMTIAYRTDSDAGQGVTTQANLSAGTSLWGTLVWGSGTWGGGFDQEEIVLSLGQARGKRIQFKFTNQNTAGQRFKIYGMNFTYNIKGKR